jgi:hypothetical protein
MVTLSFLGPNSPTSTALAYYATILCSITIT